ncbi:MAG: hypothetical protein ACOZAQ_06670 [Pseudomonadota bacterium]
MTNKKLAIFLVALMTNGAAVAVADQQTYPADERVEQRLMEKRQQQIDSGWDTKADKKASDAMTNKRAMDLSNGRLQIPKDPAP